MERVNRIRATWDCLSEKSIVIGSEVNVKVLAEFHSVLQSTNVPKKRTQFSRFKYFRTCKYECCAICTKFLGRARMACDFDLASVAVEGSKKFAVS
jgi:hypothetical protein